MNNPSIRFNFLESISLPDRIRLKRFLVTIFKKEKKSLVELQYVFCSDPYLLEINRQFLHHDFYTDIVTFNLAEKDQPTLGEIYISIDRVRDNARTFNTTITQELHRVIFHGALHLCGYKDKTAKQEQEMRQMEDKCLQLYTRFT
jgi:probable rRNA maturation factor